MPLTGAMADLVKSMAGMLDARMAFRLSIIMAGMMLADGEWMYGHNWVSLSFLATHPLWGVIAFPLRSLVSVREKDVPALEAKYGWKFRTKLELAVSLVTWFVTSVRVLDIECKIWLVTDGSHADGWKSMTYQCRGSMVTREHRTFLATSRLVSGVIHVVIVRFDDGGWPAQERSRF